MKSLVFSCDPFIMRILNNVHIVVGKGGQKTKLTATQTLIYHVFSFINAGHSVLSPTKDSENVQQDVTAGSFAM